MIWASRPLPKRRVSRVTNRRCAGMAMTPMLRKNGSASGAGFVRERKRAAGQFIYPTEILALEGPGGRFCLALRAPSPRASPDAKKAGMDRGEINVGNLSARAAISSMARALGVN